jgi:hypothetical protein
MSDTPEKNSWLHTAPGLVTAIAALITAVGGVIVLFRDTGPATQQPAANATQPLPATAPTVITGQWRDNWGTVYLVTQTGNSFTLTASGTSCKGVPYQSKGSGTISGDTMQSVYESSIGSTGSCNGIISNQGNTIDATCSDTVCGRFSMRSERQ